MKWIHAAALCGAALSVSLLGGCGCGPRNDSARWDEARQETRGEKAVAPTAAAGAKLNDFFPKAESPYGFTFKQEKQGFVMGQLSKSGKDVATFSISDTRSEPAAKEKFAKASTAVGGYPSAASGSQGTAILVGDRFQVQVRTLPGGLTEDERKSWIEKFDLAGLDKFSITSN